MLRLPALRAATGLPTSTVYWQVEHELLPTPIKIGERSVAWDGNEIIAVMTARRRGASNDEIRELVKQLKAARTAAA